MRALSGLWLGGLGVALAAMTAAAQEGSFVGPMPRGVGRIEAAPPEPTPAASLPEPQASAVEEAPPSGEREPVAAPASESLPLGSASTSNALLPSRERSAADGPEEAHAVPAPGDGWWRTAGALVLVLAVILGLWAVVKRSAGRSGSLAVMLGPRGRAPSGLLHVLARYPVGRGQSLAVLKLDRRILLVSQSHCARGGAMTTLSEITDPEEIASILMKTAESDGQTLASRFREVIAGFESPRERPRSDLAPVVVDTVEVPSAGDPLESLQSRLASLRQGAQRGGAA